MFCKNCGTKITEGGRFCRKCGIKINSVTDNINKSPIEKPNINYTSMSKNKIIIIAAIASMLIIFWFIIFNINNNVTPSLNGKVYETYYDSGYRKHRIVFTNENLVKILFFADDSVPWYIITLEGRYEYNYQTNSGTIAPLNSNSFLNESYYFFINDVFLTLNSDELQKFTTLGYDILGTYKENLNIPRIRTSN